MTIRRAAVGDEELLATLNSFVHDLHVHHRPDHFKRPQRTDMVAWFKSTLEKPTTRALIAEEDDKPVGYVLAIIQYYPGNPSTEARSWLEIDQLAVDPHYRRRGIGRALVFEAIADAKTKGIDKVEAAPWSFNENTHVMFRRLGFAPKAVRFELKTSG